MFNYDYSQKVLLILNLPTFSLATWISDNLLHSELRYHWEWSSIEGCAETELG